MLTTAWLAGQTQPPAAQPAPMGQPSAPAVQAAPAAPLVSTSPGAYNGGALGGGYSGGCGSGGCGGGGCGGCATDCCDSGARKGLLSRLFKKGNSDCGCASAPVVHYAAPAASCGCEERHGLCSKLKGLFKKGHSDCGCDAGCGSTVGGGCGCGGGGGAINYGGAPGWGSPAGVGTPIGTPIGTPAEAIPAQPRPGEAPRRMPATGGGGTPMTIGGVIRDVTPVVAPRLSIEQEGPRQPF